MKILFFGDVFGRPGREGIKQVLPGWQAKYKPDFILANVENIAHGNGVSRKTLQELQELGAFCAYTSGDHIWDVGEAKQMLEDPSWPLLRPANYPREAPGKGAMIVNSGTKKLLVINLLGRLFMKPFADDPFSKVDEILEESKEEAPDAVFVDFHAETTSEKRALGFYLQGRVSAVVGTHTHVPTADGQILEGGTAYITDVGMTGPAYSAIGLEPQAIIHQFKTQLPVKTEVGDRGAEINAVLIDVKRSGQAQSIKILREIVDFID